MDVVVDEPWAALPAALSPSARRALSRRGLLTRRWRRRLRQADPRLIRFINRFHVAPGFEHVVRAAYDSQYRRATVRMAQRLAFRLAANSGGPGSLRFGRALGFRANGQPVRTLELLADGRRYQLYPWRRLHRRVLRRQLARNQALGYRTSALRWVFDGRRLTMDRWQVAEEVRRLLRRSRANGSGQQLSWLERAIVVL